MVGLKYFEQIEGYFWEWDDNAEYLAIRKGNTIAHKRTVVDILNGLKHQGLPGFSAILLCLLATNTEPTKVDNLKQVRTHLAENYYRCTGEFLEDKHLDHVLELLKIISDLPHNYKSGTNRMLVFQALFYNCHNIISIKDSIQICHFLKKDEFLPRTITPTNYHKFHISAIRQLELIGKKISSPDDIIKAISDLPEFDEEITLFEKEEDELIQNEDYIESLIKDNNTFAVGALVKRLWSGLNLPLHNEASNQMPLGGVSDLTNKGDFSQLLISEFANDDILFLSRLANNEALYLEREAPPTDTKEKRIILIDSTIKNWGTPKTMAFAIGIALAEHPRNKVAYQAVILGEDGNEINLSNKESLIKGLQYLNGSLHPAKSLEAYLKENVGKKEEIIFITEKSNLKQAKLLEVLHKYQSDINFIIETDNEGIIDIYKKNRNGKKHLQRISLPLEQLWMQAKPKKKASIPTDIEAITHYPILFDTPNNKSISLSTDDGFIYIITRDKKLFRKVSSYRTNEKGWELITENLPICFGQFEIGINKNGKHTLLLFDTNKKVVYLLDITTGNQTDFVFLHWNIYKPSFVFYENSFRHHDWSIDTDWKLSSAELLPQSVINNREEQLQRAESKYHIVRNVLRNVKTVKISSDRRLLFNKHVFALKSNQHFKLDVCNTSYFDAEAEMIEPRTFLFADGSSVQVNRSGMLTLISSDDRIEPIFIPSTLDCALGVSTPTTFSGRNFYHAEKLVQLYLRQSDAESVKLARALSTYTHLNLEQLTDLIREAPCYLDITVDVTKGEEIITNLTQAVGGGIQIDLIPYEEKIEQKELAPDAFYIQYIIPFINNILKHGTLS